MRKRLLVQKNAIILMIVMAGSQSLFAADPCRDCHADIAAAYQHVSMSRTFASAASVPVIENYAAGNDFLHAPSGMYFRASQRDGKIYQRRYQLDENNRETRAFEQEATHVIGSGRHARSYLHLSETGELTQLPLSWYSQEGRWGMSPGYDQPKHQDFSRVIEPGCLFCHNAYPPDWVGKNGFAARPVLRGKLPGGIDCQRCHGPGARHAELARAGATTAAVSAAIVNPKKLDPKRQMDVCLQCHLETTSAQLPGAIRRFGRGVFSFRAGQDLDDYLVLFDHPPGSGHEQKFEINSAGYRLNQSPCFLKSAGKMTCTTCHDPHGVKASVARREACLSCHKPHADPARSDCAECHMPGRRAEDAVHVVMTDHRIQLRAPARDLLAALPESNKPYRGPLNLYRPSNLPEAERRLYLGLAYVSGEADLSRGISLLSNLPGAPVEAQAGLARALALQNRRAEAVAVYQRILRREPELATIRADYARVLERLGRRQEALGEFVRSLDDDPDLPAAHLGIARLSMDPSAEIEHYRQAARHPGTRPEALNNLGNLLASRGDLAAAGEALVNALAAAPDFAEAENNLARVFAARREFADAIQHLRRALTLDAHYAESRYNLARLLHASGDRPAAIVEYRRVIVSDPKLSPAHMSLGVALAEDGAWDEAITEFRETLRLDPNNREAADNLQLALEMKARRRGGND